MSSINKTNVMLEKISAQLKILVTGATGQLGWELTHTKTPHTIIGLSRAQLDITQAAQINKIIAEQKPDVVINTAAYTAVDKAEQEMKIAFDINEKGAVNLARSCAEKNIPLIHLSTNYVFSGQQQCPYREEDPTDPINVYGKSKLAGENAIRKLWDKHIILRVSGVFGVHGNNFVKTMLRLASERELLRVVADQTICPTATSDIAHTLFVIAEKNTHWGTYHFCSNEPTTWHHFTEAIIHQAKQYQLLKIKEIQAITTAEFPTPAKRPAYSVLDCSKLQKQFSITPRSWRAGLNEMLKVLYS